MLFFFPKANTSGCTKQTQAFSGALPRCRALVPPSDLTRASSEIKLPALRADNLEAFEAAGYKVYGSDLSSAKVLSNWKSKNAKLHCSDHGLRSSKVVLV